ncbi:MAG: SUMF1/EgtB/PvdO family nonheme iron enzyme [Planctomycetes bacterium]|nr:SUMF1/EgtB/PvdO family nonheme iron enzyme [Planctomycetota bacterium]
MTEIEGLAFVPAGQISLAIAGRGSATLEVPNALLVDMYESTRGEWRAFRRARAALVASELSELVDGWDDASADWPASGMNQIEAAEFARWRGMRLPTAGEWLYFASGPQRFAFPWGSTDQRSIANTLELGLDRPAAVGTFEAGRSPQQIYDLLGNVAEWTADAAPSRDVLPGDTRVSAMGGSFRNRSRPIVDERQVEGQNEVHARTLARESRADDIGVRCCVDASSYLGERLLALRPDAAARARLVAVGRRWGRRALPVLEGLAARPGAPSALMALLEGARR